MPVGNNQVFTMDLAGIPVNEEQVSYYEFRVQFLNGDGTAGIIAPPTTSSISELILNENLSVGTHIYIDDSIISSAFINRKAKFYSGSTLLFEGVAYKIDGTTIYYWFPTNAIAQWAQASTII